MQSAFRQCPVLASVKEQRSEVDPLAEAFDPADENGVIAAGMGGFVGDFKGGTASGKNRCAADTGLPGQAGKAVGRPGGEAVGEFLLVGGQDVDGVVTGLAEGGKVVRVVVEAPEHQGRIERDGRKGIDGEPDRLAVGVDGRDDGDAGGEASERVAQRAGVCLGLGHRALFLLKSRIIRAPKPPVEADFEHGCPVRRPVNRLAEAGRSP